MSEAKNGETAANSGDYSENSTIQFLENSKEMTQYEKLGNPYYIA